MSQVDPNIDIKSDNNLLTNGQVDTDIKSDTNLLNNADTVQDVNNRVLTEVTSVAAEEQRTGIQMPIPSGEELYNKAMMSFIRNMKFLNDLVSGKNGGSYKISRKGMNRVMNSILQLPQDGMPVVLQNNEEKAAFALGQRLIADRYLITHHHILLERKRLQDLKNSANVNQQEQVSTKEGVTNE